MKVCITANRYIIEASGGDFHNAMLNPVFIRFLGKKGGYVFKPRDMRVDKAVADMITFFRPVLQQMGLELTARFGINSGYMRLYRSPGKISLEMADVSFRKMGALILIIVLYGVKDLHNGNIMATVQGADMSEWMGYFRRLILADVLVDGRAFGEPTNDTHLGIGSDGRCVAAEYY